MLKKCFIIILFCMLLTFTFVPVNSKTFIYAKPETDVVENGKDNESEESLDVDLVEEIEEDSFGNNNSQNDVDTDNEKSKSDNSEKKSNILVIVGISSGVIVIIIRGFVIFKSKNKEKKISIKF